MSDISTFALYVLFFSYLLSMIMLVCLGTETGLQENISCGILCASPFSSLFILQQRCLFQNGLSKFRVPIKHITDYPDGK